jgi:hypothetical protein
MGKLFGAASYYNENMFTNQTLQEHNLFKFMDSVRNGKNWLGEKYFKK